MAHGADKYRSRRNRACVRQVLWRDWDPIGVNTLSGPQDEYNAYADRAYVMLMDERRSAEEIAAYLNDIANDYMGLGDRPEIRSRSRLVANALIHLVPQFEAESNEPF
jgi:hypothetical protein